MKNDVRNTLYCSFCGKSQHDVPKLVAGPTVFICNECIATCVEIFGENMAPENPLAPKFTDVVKAVKCMEMESGNA